MRTVPTQGSSPPPSFRILCTASWTCCAKSLFSPQPIACFLQKDISFGMPTVFSGPCFSCRIWEEHGLVWLLPVLLSGNCTLCQGTGVVVFFFADGLHFVGGNDLLTITLSITSVTSFMSCVLADDMTTDSGMPFLSVKMCLFVPGLLLSVGLLPVIAPLKATWLICCQRIAKPIWYLFYNLVLLTVGSDYFWIRPF
jgi:hypothetical protein